MVLISGCVKSCMRRDDMDVQSEKMHVVALGSAVFCIMRRWEVFLGLNV